MYKHHFRLFAIFCFAVSLTHAQMNVTTWHNDNWRAGQNTSETSLTQSLSETNFGLICSAKVDGQIYGQPLAVWNSTTQQNTVYVVTLSDSIYSFNGSTCAQIAHANLLDSGYKPTQVADICGPRCSFIQPQVGILGTPVIDLGTNTIYLDVDEEKTDGSSFQHRIHALDTATLVDKPAYNSPQTISGSYGAVTFAPKFEIQRPGLLFILGTTPQKSMVYVAFSKSDGSPSNPSGWIFAYEADNLQNSPKIYATAAGNAQSLGAGICKVAAA
jgi:hypothetical protein